MELNSKQRKSQGYFSKLKEKQALTAKRTTGGLPYTIVENGYQYDYGTLTSIRLSVWAKGRKDNGLRIDFKDFYEELPAEEKSRIRIQKYNSAKHTGFIQ